MFQSNYFVLDTRIDAFKCCSDLAHENAYEEDEGETCAYLYEKKYLMQQRINGVRPYEIGTGVPYEPCMESNSGKRPSSSFLAIPPKRVRTAARRVVSPFPASVGGTPQVTSKTSSGDTSSYQDDQSSLHGGTLPWENMDYESTVDFDRQLPYDSSEVWARTNKKKKHKNPGYKASNSYASAAVKVTYLIILSIFA